MSSVIKIFTFSDSDILFLILPLGIGVVGYIMQVSSGESPRTGGSKRQGNIVMFYPVIRSHKDPTAPSFKHTCKISHKNWWCRGYVLIQITDGESKKLSPQGKG